LGENRAVSGKGKILVVDDDRLVLATVTHGLARAGYEVIDADNGDDAILLAHQHRPDLALLDIRMEGKSGFDVAAYLRASLGTPFMFLSAFADDETVAQVKALGAVAYLVKPLDDRRDSAIMRHVQVGCRKIRCAMCG
jgi:response regulator NasT